MFNTEAPAAIDSDVCKAFIKIVADATNHQIEPLGAICTYYLEKAIKSIPYTEKQIDPAIISRISSSEAPKPISEAMKSQAQSTPPMEIQEGPFPNYIVQNVGNPLVLDEIIFTEAIGYTTETSHYLAIPFPSGQKAKGVFFLFLHNEPELAIAKAHLSEIVLQMEQVLS